MNQQNLPSDEDFARARAAMRERDRGLSEARSRILERFRQEGLHEAFLFFSPTDQTFYARLFFRWNNQVVEADASDLLERIKEAVREEMERAGRGQKSELKIEFEFDSHENVEANFEGDYYLRLR